jgi:hypothetical protein
LALGYDVPIVVAELIDICEIRRFFTRESADARVLAYALTPDGRRDIAGALDPTEPVPWRIFKDSDKTERCMQVLREDAQHLAPGKPGGLFAKFALARRVQVDPEGVRAEIAAERAARVPQSPAETPDPPAELDVDTPDQIDDAIEMAAAIMGDDDLVPRPVAELPLPASGEDVEDDADLDPERVGLAGGDDALEHLREITAALRSPVNMRQRAFDAARRLAAENARFDAHHRSAAEPTEPELEKSREAAARGLRTWLGDLPRPMWPALGSASPLEPWTGGPSGFARMYPGPLSDIATRLFAIPASSAEAERTIKIIRAVIGRHSSQMSNQTLIDRVRLVMQCLQERRAAATAARAGGLLADRPPGTRGPSGAGLGPDGALGLFLAGVDADIDRERADLGPAARARPQA